MTSLDIRRAARVAGWRTITAALYALAVTAAVGAPALWFVAIWTHRSDVIHRLVGTGFLSLLVGCGCAILGYKASQRRRW